MMGSEMCDHIKSTHPEIKIRETNDMADPQPQRFKSTKSWAEFTSAGNSFSMLYCVDDFLGDEHTLDDDGHALDDDGHALIWVHFSTQKKGGRGVIAARVLAATKEIDVENMKVEIKVALKDDQTATLNLKPTRSTGTKYADCRELRCSDRDETPLSIATSALRPRPDNKAGLAWTFKATF